MTKQELYAKGIRVWSWSRVGSHYQCPLSYLYKYDTKVEEKDQSGYGKFGGLVHECSEFMQKGEWTHEQALQHYKEKMDHYEYIGLKVAYGDQASYRENNRKFLESFRPVENARTEVELLGQVDGRWFTGYIDLLHVNRIEGEGADAVFYMSVGDYKTSKVYAGAKKHHNAMQLILYAYLLEITYPNIRVETLYWNHVQLASVSFNGSSGSRKLRGSMYIDFVKRMIAYCKKNELDIPDEDIMEYALKNEPHPQLAHLFEISDCIVEVPYDEKEVERLKSYIKIQCGIIEHSNEFKPKIDEGFCNGICGFRWCCEAFHPRETSQTAEIFKDVDLSSIF